MDLVWRTPEDEIAALRHELAAARGHLALRLSELLPWNCEGAVEARTA